MLYVLKIYSCYSYLATNNLKFEIAAFPRSNLPSWGIRGGLPNLFGNFPDDNASGYAHIERVFGAKLRQFQTAIARIDNGLLHAFHLVAKHHGVFAATLGFKSVQRAAAFGLLHGKHRETSGFERNHRIESVGKMPPRHGKFRPKSRFVNLGIGRRGSDTTQQHLLDTVGIGRAKNRPNIVQTAHIVEHNNERQFIRRRKLLGRQPPNLLCLQFAIHDEQYNSVKV